jgi:hypothetical protein
MYSPYLALGPDMSRKIARPIQPLSDRFLLAVAFTVGSAIAVLSSVTNQALMHCDIPAAASLVKWNAAAGVLSILLIWKLLRWSRERNELIRERDRVIIALNHEVRNAIQVISLSDYHNRGAEATDVKLSVRRIERALDEYVPNPHAVAYCARSSSRQSA